MSLTPPSRGDSPRRGREPPCPPSALSWHSGPSAAARGSPRRTQGLLGRALGSSAPAGWLSSRAALSGAASRPSTAPGWLGWRGSGTGSSVRGAGERVCPGLAASRKASRPRPFPPPSSPFPPPRPQPPPPPPRPRSPPGPLLCWFPLRSGAPGSGLVTWPSRHPVALKKKSDCVSQTTDRVSKSYFSPPHPLTKSPPPPPAWVCRGGTDMGRERGGG